MIKEYHPGKKAYTLEERNDLVRQHVDWAYRIATRRWRNLDKEDVCSIVNGALVRARDNFNDPQEENFQRFLAVVIRNALINAYAKEKRGRKAIQDLSQEMLRRERHSIHDAYLMEDEEQVNFYLRRIPRKYAESFRMAVMDNMTYRETADRLRIPVGTVMSRIHRARKCLREVLAAEQ